MLQKQIILGNIIHNSPIIDHVKKPYIKYTNNIDNVDLDKPTLIIGWDYFKNKYPNVNVSIIDNCVIKNKLYWVFSFDEEKSQHVNGVRNFINNLTYYVFNNNYKYLDIDPIFFNIKTIDDLFKILPKNIEYSYQFRNKSCFLLKENKVYGINLEMYKFLNFDIKRILENIKNISSKFILDDNGDIYVDFRKIYFKYPHLKRYLVVFLSKSF